MARRIDRQKAIELRKEGKSYGEIKLRLGISKSTLSGWLKDLPLTSSQISKLNKNIKSRKTIGIEKTVIVKLNKRKRRLKEVYETEKKNIFPLTKRELYLCGLFLYWGEGTKGLKSGVSISNTDPRVVKFFLFWLLTIVKIPKEKIRARLHIYKDMNINKSTEFWSRELDLPSNQFIKPYIKDSFRSNLDQKGFGYGTCDLYVYDQNLKEKIILGIDAIAKEITGIKSRNLI